MTDSLRELADRIRGTKRLTVLTGAGVSAASGVPTFRGPDGLWRKYRPEELATPQAFARDPALVWEWYAWRRETIAGCRPNRAHEVLASWTQHTPALGAPTCRVVTQNVDDLHLRAGTRDLVRLHGSIWELSCWERCPGSQTSWRDERVPLPEHPPRCIHCGALARPAVVWFGESLEAANVEAAIEATNCDVFLTVGTSAVVHPAAGLVHEAKRRGAFTAEINPDSTPASMVVDLALHARAEEVLDRIESWIRS
jgi:NAD-dependent deacetylase